MIPPPMRSTDRLPATLPPEAAEYGVRRCRDWTPHPATFRPTSPESEPGPHRGSVPQADAAARAAQLWDPRKRDSPAPFGRPVATGRGTYSAPTPAFRLVCRRQSPTMDPRPLADPRRLPFAARG